MGSGFAGAGAQPELRCSDARLMEELVTVLQHAQSADGAVRSQAEARLQQFAAQSYAGYLVALAGVLASGSQQPETRQLAGVVLKNCVQSTGEAKNVRGGARLPFQPSSADRI